MRKEQKHRISPVGDILHYLIRNYAPKLGVTQDTFAADFTKHSRITPKTVNLWLAGSNRPIRERSANELSRYFSRCIPGLRPEWFRVRSLEEFREIEKNALHVRHGLHFEMSPGIAAPDDITHAGEDIPGLYHVYRYAFENTGRIAKELLYIHMESDYINSTFYFRVRGRTGPETLRRSCGTVIPVGDNYVILGFTLNPDRIARPRVRALLLKYQGLNLWRNRYRVGILLSSSADTQEPSAVRVILQRIDAVIQDPERYADQEVRFLSQEEAAEHFEDKWRDVLDIISNEINSATRRDYVLSINTTQCVEILLAR